MVLASSSWVTAAIPKFGAPAIRASPSVRSTKPSSPHLNAVPGSPCISILRSACYL